jgi:hypothetical protein
MIPGKIPAIKFQTILAIAGLVGSALLFTPQAAVAERTSLSSIDQKIDDHDLSVQSQLGAIQSSLAGPLAVTTATETNARTPFAVRFTVPFGSFRGIPTSDRVAGDTFDVPAGSILVIEQITLRATTANTDDVGFVEVRVATDGTTNSHTLPVRSDVRSLPAGTTQKIEGQSWSVKFYADPGSAVLLNLNSIAGSPSGSAAYTVSGYLVPAVSPTLGP